MFVVFVFIKNNPKKSKRNLRIKGKISFPELSSLEYTKAIIIKMPKANALVLLYPRCEEMEFDITVACLRRAGVS